MVRAPVLMLVLLSACSPAINVRVLQPAMVTLPGDVKTLVIIDRSKAKNAGETVLGVLEGAVTGEAIGADTEGRHKAIESLTMILDESPRFEVVVPTISGDRAESSLFDKTLSWEAAERICKRNNAEAIVALESFDSDSIVNTTTGTETATEDGKEVTHTYHVAERNTTVLTAWRVYYPAEHRVVDDLRDRTYGNTWEQKAYSLDEAMANLPGQIQTIELLATSAGDEYARRIAPNYIDVRRTYYSKGHDRLKEAKNHVKASDWEGAGRIWEKMAEKQDDPKVRGRAEFNLALYHETLGDLKTASEFAKKAAVDLHNGKSRRYSSTIAMRLLDQKKLEEQMSPVDAPEAGSPTERQGDAPPPRRSPTERTEQP